MSDSYRRTRLIGPDGLVLKTAGKETKYNPVDGGFTADVFTGFMNHTNANNITVTITGTRIYDQTGNVGAITMIPAVGTLYPIMCSGLTASTSRIIGFLD